MRELQVVSREHLLSVLFLALWVARKAVLASDVMRWAMSGQLPYLNMASHVRHLTEASPVHLPVLLSKIPSKVAMRLSTSGDVKGVLSPSSHPLPHLHCIALVGVQKIMDFAS